MATNTVYANESIEDFFENAASALHWVDARGIILRANQYELDALGYERDEYVGHHISEFHADPAVIADILDRLGRNETLRDYEAPLLAKDGSIRHALGAWGRVHPHPLLHPRHHRSQAGRARARGADVHSRRLGYRRARAHERGARAHQRRALARERGAQESP